MLYRNQSRRFGCDLLVEAEIQNGARESAFLRIKLFWACAKSRADANIAVKWIRAASIWFISMRFSASGADIPEKLIEAAIRGRTVFLVGAGVSLPSDLPGFEALTEKIYAALGLTIEPAERHSFEQKRFEETLGTLSRRLADSRLLYGAVANELNADKAKAAQTHSTVLRLSRDFEGRHVVVTTNFDTLLERALFKETGQPISSRSFAGALIPAPGGPRFEGIIHLHGRLADTPLGLDQSDLVLTSADYGDAYLRSGWAARFLYDLARTRTIVLVGYSASDAPVRYILNILEADRDRFPDLNEVFVLADRGTRDLSDAEAAWEAIAVRPVIYEAPQNDHTQFWTDMAAWADLVELPSEWRKSRLQGLVGRPVDQLAEWEREQARWILGQPESLDQLPDLEVSEDWMAFAKANGLIRPDRRSSLMVGMWAAKRLVRPEAFREVLGVKDLGPEAADVIDRALTAEREEPLPKNLETAWRLLTIVLRQPRYQERWYRTAALGRIRNNRAAGHDLMDAIAPFIPRLLLSLPSQYSEDIGDDDSEALPLSSLCRVELETDRNANLNDLLALIIPDSPYAPTLLQLASNALVNSLILARDAQLTGGDYDAVSYDVPSVRDHPQNELHHGLLSLVRLCAESWAIIEASDPETSHAVSLNWKLAGFGLTTRLWLHALGQSSRVGEGDVVDELTELSREDFWAHRKEVMELLRDKSSGADLAKIDALIARILAGPSGADGPADDLQMRGSDSSIWAYLEALAIGNNRSPNTAKTAADAIIARRGWTNRRLEEADFFWLWSSEGQWGPIGDPEPIAEAPTEQRIEIASDLERHDRFNQQDVWQVYCQRDPAGALDAVIAVGYSEVNSERWVEGKRANHPTLTVVQAGLAV